MKIHFEKLTQNREAMIRGLLLLLLDAVMVIVSMTGALWVRFDFRFQNIEATFWHSVREYMWFNVPCTLAVNALFRMYTSLWRFASIVELKNLVFSVIVSSGLQVAGMRLLHLRVPRSYIIIYVLLLTVLMIVPRFSYRFLRIRHRRKIVSQGEPVVTMIVGAGAGGFMMLREMKNSRHLNRKVPCIIDDDPKKTGTWLQGVPVVGGKEDIPAMVKKYGIEEIVIAIPTLSPEKRKELLEICQQTACKILMLPGIYQMVNQEVDVSMLREVQIEDLLGRGPCAAENGRDRGIHRKQGDPGHGRGRLHRQRDLPAGGPAQSQAADPPGHL